MPLPTLLMLPGTLCDERIFATQRRHLHQYANVVCASYKDMKDRSVWLQSLLRRMPERFYIAGFSLGGLLALELLRIAPARVQGLVLIASNAQAASRASQRKSAWLRRLWLDRGPGEVARHVKPGYFHHESKRRRHEKLLFDMAMQTPHRSAFEEFGWAALRPSGLHVLSAFAGPLLVLSGRQDRLCPPSVQIAMATAQPRAKWLQFERCGHFLPLEAPSQLSHALQAWINELNQSPAPAEHAQHAINSGVIK
jgi:pimeloyl-ACP methyl ester carboxylesterase